MASLYTSTAFMEHASHPDWKYRMEAPTHVHEGVNPSCGDELVLELRVDGGRVEEAAFTGSGCAVSQASADIMSGLVEGKPVAEARRLAGLFFSLLRGEELTAADREALGEAVLLEGVSRMPARVKCAELAWRTLDAALGEGPREGAE